MPENTIVNPNPNPPVPATPAPPVAASFTSPIKPTPIPVPLAVSNPQPRNSSWLPPAAPAKPPPPPRPKSSLSLLIKIGAGVLVLTLLLGSYIFLVLPNMSKLSSAKVTLVYWGAWEDQKVMQPLIDAFEKQHPNITIDYVDQDIKGLAKEGQAYPSRLIARINAGKGPDIFRYHNNWYPMLSSVLAPMSKNVVSTQDFTSTYYPVVSQDLVHNGAIYGIPLDFDTLAMFVNPSIFKNAGEKIPSDLIGVESVAPDLTVKGPDGEITTSGVAMGSLQNIAHGPDILGLLLADSGVDPSNISQNTAGVSNALQYFTLFTSGDYATWADNLPNAVQMFASGNLAMYFGYSWDILTIEKLNPSLHFAVYPMPSDSGVKRTIASYWVEGVSIRSQHMPEAMEFMNFLNQKTTQQMFYSSAAKIRGFGELYARPDLADSLKSNKLLYPFEEQGPDAVSTIFNSNTFDGGLNDQSIYYLDSALNKLSSNGSIQDSVDTLAKGITQVTQQYGK